MRSRVAVGDGSWSIELMTGYLERGDGRPLSSDVEPVARSSVRSPLRRPIGPDEINDRREARSSRVVRERGRRGHASQLESRADQEPSVANDPVVQKAVRLLRQSLKKFDLTPSLQWRRHS